MYENRKVLYLTVIDAINNHIKNNKLKPGDQIPSEPELTKMLNVSRATVRMAIQELVNAGVLEKAQGKGTFVKPPATQIDINQFLSFSTTVKKMGLSSRSQILRFEIVSAEEEDVLRNLNLNKGDQVYEIFRLRFLEEDPVMYERTYIPLSAFPNFQVNRLKKESFYDICESYGFHYMNGKERIVPTLLTLEESQYLQTTAGEPAILLIKTMTSYNRCIEYTKGILKKGKFELVASIVKINL